MGDVSLGLRLKRYKLGTAKVVDWLTSTARKAAHQRGERLGLGAKLTTKDLVRLAQYISTAIPPVAVPADILTATADVIKGRAFCANVFQEVGNGNGCNSESLVDTNKRHRHFIVVLEEVQRCLKGLPIAQPERNIGGQRQRINRNLFDILRLDEPESVSTTEPSSAHANAGRSANPRLELEEDEEASFAFAIWCAFQDFHEIRLYVRGVWRSFYNGQISYLAASYATHAAFDVLKTIGMELPEKYYGYQIISTLLCIESSLATDQHYLKTGALECQSGTTHDAAVAPAELFCAPAWAVMQDYRLSCGASRNWQRGVYAELRLSSHPLSETLRRVIPIIRCMSTKSAIDNRIEGFMVDLFIIGLIEIDELGWVSTWCVAQCQILMDIVDVLSQNPGLGYSSFLNSLERSSGTQRLERLYNVALSRQTEQSTNEQQRAVDALRRQLDDARTNQFKIPEDMIGSYIWPEDKQPETLAKVLPQLAGLRVVSGALSRCNLRISIANSNVFLLAMAYVYRAAQYAGLLTARWEDMETLIASQTMHGNYVREAADIEGYAKHFDLAIGVPASTLVRNRIPSLPSKSAMQAKMKQLKIPSSLVLSFSEVKGMTGTGKSDYSAMIRTAQRVYGTINRPETRRNFTPLEILRACQQSLVQDQNLIAFDYSGLASRCRGIIYNTLCHLGGRLDDASRKATNFDSAAAAKLVHDALWEAADFRISGKNASVGQGTILAEFALKIRIDPGPDYWTLAAREGSSGHIAAADKPCNKWPLKEDTSTSSASNLTSNTKERVDLLTKDKIRNAACRKYREWASQDWTSEQRVRKTELWTDRELRKAGFVNLETKIALMDEYDQILIELRSAV